VHAHAAEPAPVLVVGIAVVDAIARPVDAFPAPGGLRFFDHLTFTTGGNAINCSIALACLGVPARVVARVGNDPLGDFVCTELARHGVCARSVARDPARSTSFSFVSVPSSGERSFLHTTGANATLVPSDVPADAMAHARIAFVTGTMLMDALDAEPTAALLRDARARGARTLLDTVYVEGLPRDEWRRRVLPALPHLDYVLPSEAEARAITGRDDPADMARALLDAGARHAVIKLGERGVLCLDERRTLTLVPAFRVPAVSDTTGAGDCWCAGFISGLLDAKPMTEAARVGNAVAAVSVTGPGASTALAARANDGDGVKGGRQRVMELLRG
jgi:sugar/nucleoside kinase (ribokinase family)